ncbi:MAG TPA: nuclear transport factor 2 family protein [Thermoleophilaceae bacterium]
MPDSFDTIDLASVDVARERRRPHERLLVRFPVLARALFGLGSRLPVGSRSRRFLLTRLAEQAASAANRRDFDVLTLGLDPELDYCVISGGPGGGIVPDLVGHHYGPAGYVHVWRTMLEGFDDLTLVPEELRDLGDRLVSTTRLRGHGSGSGVPIDQHLFQVFTLRRGLAVKQEDFGSRAEALAAAGVPEARAPERA